MSNTTGTRCYAEVGLLAYIPHRYTPWRSLVMIYYYMKLKHSGQRIWLGLLNSIR